MNTSGERLRKRALRRVRRILERRGAPRVQMALVVFATGLAGFSSSAAMLHLGIKAMALRYVLAVGVAYLVFLLLIWLWLMIHRAREKTRTALDVADGVSNLVDVPGDIFGGAGDIGSEIASGLDLDEMLLVLALLAVVLMVLAVCVYLIVIAPSMLAEVLLDGALSAGLYRRLSKMPGQLWALGVVRRTWVPVLIVVFFFLIAGLVMQYAAPGADSIGDVLEYLRMRDR